MSGRPSLMRASMSARTTQPLPVRHLERERHIQVVLRAFQGPRGTSCECGTRSPESESHRDPPDLVLKEEPAGVTSQRSEDRRHHHHHEPEEQEPEGAASSNFTSHLETVGQIHITARPDLQGPQCVSRRIYSVSTGGTSSQTFVAVEESSCLCLQCCGPARACSLQGFDSQGHQIFYFERPLRVDACCFGCCLMEMRAYTPQRRLIGTVYQRWSVFTPLLEVCDSDGASLARIQGSCCPCRCFSNHRFQIVSDIGEQLGTVWKKWPGFNDQHNMDHEYFGLDVTKTLESNTKLLLLAATFLTNHMFFEMS